MHETSHKRPMAQSLLDIDKEIARLLSRRAKLLNKANAGRRGTNPALEKQLRQSWETNAARFSRDPRFIRQFFTLMQEIEVDTREETTPRTGFNLAPSRRPVNVAITAPVSSRMTRLWLTLAAATGRSLSIDNALINDPLNDLVKALNQSGGRLAWDEVGTVRCKAESHLDFSDKVIYVGEDTLNLYLLVFLAAGKNSRLKLTGGSDLKFTDLAPLSHFLPQLGARLTNVVPGTKGLPVRIECSGVMSDTLTIPANLPIECVSALILAAATWSTSLTLNLEQSPYAESCMEMILPIFDIAGIRYQLVGKNISLIPSVDQMPLTLNPEMTADILLATSLLAFPAFAGGTVRLNGNWPSCALGKKTLALLQAGGLNVSAQKGTITSSYASPASADYTEVLQGLSAEFAPIALAFAAAAVAAGKEVLMPVMPSGIENNVAEDFLAQLGLAPNAESTKLEAIETTIAQEGWASPAPQWSMAMAMTSFLRSGLRIANPGNMTQLMPAFWSFFNGLPSPDIAPKPKEPVNDKPTRRRVLAD